MGMPPVGPETIERFEALAEVFAGTFGDAMTFKLEAGDRAAALAPDGVEPFEPMPGRAMGEWVLVPLTDAHLWDRLAEQAWRFLAT